MLGAWAQQHQSLPGLPNITLRGQWTRLSAVSHLVFKSIPSAIRLGIRRTLLFKEVTAKSPEALQAVCGTEEPKPHSPTSPLPPPSPPAGSGKPLPCSHPLDTQKACKYPAVLETLSPGADFFNRRGHVLDGYRKARMPTFLSHGRAHP